MTNVVLIGTTPGGFILPQTPAEITAGITPANTGYLENDIRRYAVSPGTGGDDTTAINNTLAVAFVNGRPATFAGLSLLSSGGHTHDISKFSVNGNGALIYFSTMSGGSIGWSITATVGGTSNDSQHGRFCIREIDFKGTNIGTGIKISATAEPAASFFALYSVSIENFATSVLLGNNVYDVDFYGCNINGATTAISIPNGLTNAYERVTYHGGSITNITTAISNQNGNGELYLKGTSIDSAITYLSSANGARTYLSDCHLEIINTSATSALFQLEGGVGNNLTIWGGALLCTGGSQPFGWSAIFDIAAGSNVVLGGGILLNNLNNTAGVLCTGAGNMTIYPPTLTFNSGLNPTIVGTGSNFSILYDPSFETATNGGSPLCTLLTAGSATVTVTNSQHHTGSQSLQCIKSTGTGNSSSFAIMVPVQPGQRIGITGWYMGSSGQTNTIFAYGYWSNPPLGGGTSNIGFIQAGTGANITTIPTSWTQFTIGQYVVPAGIYGFALNFNLGNMTASTFYIDDISITAM